MPETIIYDVADGVATITLNRPERLNAYNRTMQGELLEAFDATDADDDVRAVVVTEGWAGLLRRGRSGGGRRDLPLRRRGRRGPGAAVTAVASCAGASTGRSSR